MASELYNVSLAPGFSDPAACPWLRYNYVCSDKPAYRRWLEKWAVAGSPLQPVTARLPRGTSLWFGMSHMYQYAAAMMCQHRADLLTMHVLRCTSIAVSTCISKQAAFHREARSCMADPLGSCTLVEMPLESRCAPDAWSNVYGENGTHPIPAGELPVMGRTKEDGACGRGSSQWPGLTVHPHPLSRFCHPASAIPHLQSRISHPASAVRHPAPAILHPPSAILHPLSCTWPSRVRYPASTILPSCIYNLACTILTQLLNCSWIRSRLLDEYRPRTFPGRSHGCRSS